MQRTGKGSVTPFLLLRVFFKQAADGSENGGRGRRGRRGRGDPRRNTSDGPFSFFQKSNLILLFARRSSPALEAAAASATRPLFFLFSFFFSSSFYPHCFPRSIICVKKIGRTISETFGLPSQGRYRRIHRRPNRI